MTDSISEKNYRVEKRHPCEKYPNGATVFVKGDKKIILENVDPEVIKAKVRQILKTQLIFLEKTVKDPNPDPEIPIAETLLNLHAQLNDSLEGAENILNSDEISDLRNKFAELSVQILKLIF